MQALCRFKRKKALLFVNKKKQKNFAPGGAGEKRANSAGRVNRLWRGMERRKNGWLHRARNVGVGRQDIGK